MYVHRLRMLDSPVVKRLLKLRGVVEKSCCDRLADGICIVGGGVQLKLDPLHHGLYLLSNVSSPSQRADLDEVLEAPLIREVGLCPLVPDVEQRQVVASRTVEINPRIIRMQRALLWTIEDRGANLKHGGDRQDLRGAAVACGDDQHLAQLRIHGELRHPPPQLGELPSVVEGAKRVELLQGAYQCLGRGRVHKIEVDEVIDPQGFEHEHNGAQIGALDLRDRVVFQLVEVRPPRVHSEAFPRGDTPGTASTLVGGRLGNRCDNERLHSRARVVRILLGEPRIDDVNDVIDRDRSLRNVGRQHYLPRARWRWFKNLRLHVRGQVGING
mmetsp:Transcript_1213/g.2993  ORF Transcript_1213/g.2993 Transcript_1213/m.2993 type:complete len:328 (-) Transcript_1213:214-1197(-)